MFKIFSSTENDKYLFDTWSFIHINSSFIIFNILNSFIEIYKAIFLTLVIVIGWEFYENNSDGIKFFRKFDDPKYNGDTHMNIFGDIISDSFGIFLGYMLTKFTRLHKYIGIILIYGVLEIIPYYLSNINIITNISKFLKLKS